METVPAVQTHRVRRRRGLRHRLGKLMKSPSFLKAAVVVVANAVFIAMIVAVAAMVK